jgi:hypothetical protein
VREIRVPRRLRKKSPGGAGPEEKQRAPRAKFFSLVQYRFGAVGDEVMIVAPFSARNFGHG